MQDIFKAKNDIFEMLKIYVEANSKYKPLVLKRAIESKTPLVVFRETQNKVQNPFTTYGNTFRNLNFEIEIYAKDEGSISGEEICEEITQYIIEVMENRLHLNGGLQAIIPMYNNGKPFCSQASFKYNTRYNIKTDMLF